MNSGIVSYGIYVPRYRILPESIGAVWGEDGKRMGKGLGINAKSVPAPDEDTTTISVMAARRAMARCKVDPSLINAIYVGSESHPYAVKPTATIVSQAISASPDLTAADLEFACKAGTAGLQAALGLVERDRNNMPVEYAMAIGADTSQGAPGNVLEYSASAGGCAYIVGRENVIADIKYTTSYTTDTPDFWRREGMKYPSHGERFTGVPAYFKHVKNCTMNVMKDMGTEASDYDYATFHQPNGKFPIKIARSMGFSMEQIEPGLWTPKIGNTYSASMMIGLAGILDIAKPGDRILAVSYGSGAGSDGFHIEVTDQMETFDKGAAPLLSEVVEKGKIIDYATYIKYREKIKLEGE